MKDDSIGTLTVNEVKDILRIGANSVYVLIHSKEFPVIKIGHSYRILKEPFLLWLKNGGSAMNSN